MPRSWGLGLAFFLLFFWLVSTSFKELDQIFKLPPVWIPDPVRWQNYPEALGYFPFLKQLQNTLVIAISAVILTLLSSTLVAYSFSRLQWPGRNLLFLFDAFHHDVTLSGHHGASLHHFPETETGEYVHAPNYSARFWCALLHILAAASSS